MPLSKQDNDYRFPLIKLIDAKLIDIDRVFTNLLPLIKHQGAPLTRRRSKFVTLDDLLLAMEADNLNFDGFKDNEEIVLKWLESDFLSLVHRGKDKQQIAAPLPMHLNTYKLRNAKHCRDYGVADQVFSLLYHGAPDVLKALEEFLSRGVDYYSDKYDDETDLDIETLVMMRILDQKEKDHPDYRQQTAPPYPVYIGQAHLLGDDIARLLAYQNDMPRLVLIDHIKNVIALHMGIYILQLFQVIPDLVENGQLHPTCHTPNVIKEGMGVFIEDTVFPIHIVTDMGEDYRTHMAELARQQFGSHMQQLNRYVRAHIKLKKLQEFAIDLEQRGLITRPQSLEEYLALQNYADELELKTYFEIRIRSLMATNSGDDPDERLLALRRLGLSELDTYVEMVYLLRQGFHQKYYTQLIESLFQKNRENGLMRAGYGRINKRRYSLGSGLLETLVQIAVLESLPEGNFRTRTIRVDDFVEWLRRRYGIYISQLPEKRTPTIVDLEAFRLNIDAFKSRLREIGFYTDLSDAYIAQVIRPRYHIG